MKSKAMEADVPDQSHFLRGECVRVGITSSATYAGALAPCKGVLVGMTSLRLNGVYVLESLVPVGTICLLVVI